MAQHISVRVPWHDNGWNGTICVAPGENNSCLRLKNIYENRDDADECALCGKCMEGLEEHVPCIGEGAAFMSAENLIRSTVHPYKQTSPKSHGHFLPTDIIYPAYSFPTRPFAWLMKKNIEKRVENFGIKYDPKREPQLGFATGWVQEAENQRAIFNYFYGDIVPDESICVAYAKQVPFVEDHRRVIIGMGHVKRVVPAVEHNHLDEPNALRCMTWETHICHSIRPDHQDGFVIPYQEMMSYAKEHPEFDMSKITVFAQDEAFEEFSYESEHVSHDAMIDVILSSIKAFEVINSCLNEDYSNVLAWLNKQLAEVWDDRGAFPGLGPMLTALEIPLGVLIAKQIREQAKEKDIWELVDKVFVNPEEVLTSDLAVKITPIMKRTWKEMPDERKVLFRLLSRIAISIDQAKIIFFESERKKNHILCTDEEIIGNPYILYEKTRLKAPEYTISVTKVDRAIFPVSSIMEKYPVEEPSKLKSDNDERRIRAVAVSALEKSAMKGHTILPCDILVDQIHELTLKPVCPVTSDILYAVENFMLPEILKDEMKDGTKYYKLVRFKLFDDIIESRISRRLNAPELNVVADWRGLIDEKFNEVNEETGEIMPISEQEERARQEKSASLEVLAQSRISVLVGDAGTGKTTVLSILCAHPDIKAGGVLLLAPTGKATVRLLESMEGSETNYTALNVAQFLIRSGRFDWNDKRYISKEENFQDVPNTVIIDESSMLTEEMFGALMQALKRARRIIFVGDPNQLPPIGAGRPFVDLVYMLRENLNIAKFPKTCEHYAELTVNRRQKGDELRTDVRLSKLFTSTEAKPDDDIITEIERNGSPNIKFVKWSSKEELENILIEVVAQENGLQNPDDQEGFDRALGAVVQNGYTYFNLGSAAYADKWQILAPVKNMPQGVMNINRLFHLKYRKKYLELAKTNQWPRYIAPQLGPEGIVYGDKVINVINTSEKEGYPEYKSRHYIANGEIGIACGNFRRNNKDKFIHVEFSTQPGAKFSFDKHDFDDEKGTAQLELAYALTVHKAQGSQFDTVILVIAEPCQLISRELLYTALTRQLGKIVILYNQDSYHLLNYSTDANSDIAQRFTDLFRNIYGTDEGPDLRPQITEVSGHFYEEKLIHKTVRGELVRSKSEVAIANALFYNKIDYEYEPVLKFDNCVKRPDFKVEDYDTGARGKLFLQSRGKEFFNLRGKQNFNRCGKENFNTPGKQFLNEGGKQIFTAAVSRI